MRTIRSLPGPKFRLVAVASLAALAVGSTVVGSGADDTSEQSAAEATEPPTGDDTEPEGTESAITASTPSAVDELDVDAPATSVAAPSTVAATPEVDDIEPPVVTVVETAAVSLDGEPAPVSGVPVVVDDGDTDACPAPTADAAPAPAPMAAPTPTPTTTVTSTAPATDGAAGATSVSFDDGAPGWVVLSGAWSAVDGEYVQTDETGYDFISQYPGDVGSEYAATVRLRALGDSLGGGLIVGQPVPGSRRGATLIDFTDGGRFLRWGRYDADSGQYQYVGGVATGDAFDVSAEHSLTVEARATRTLVVVDGAAIGEFGPIGPGRIGLATSLSAVAFDDLEIVDL